MPGYTYHRENGVFLAKIGPVLGIYSPGKCNHKWPAPQ
jgi:hypothetical protein